MGIEVQRKYSGMGQSELHRAKALESENARLNRILAERKLEIDAMKENSETPAAP
jgi:putative transposase